MLIHPNTIKEKQRQQAITNHTKRIIEPIEEIIADLAIDGISFRKIVENKSIRKSFSMQGYDWPKSASTAQKYLF